MTDEQTNKLLEIDSLVRVLLTKYKQTKEELSDLKDELKTFESELIKSQEEIAKLKLENASLKSATAVSYTKNEALEERERLKNIIRKVDKCISLLKE